MASRPCVNKGKKFHTCDVCGRKKINVAVAKEPFRFIHGDRTFPEGTLVCSCICGAALPADHPYFALADEPVTHELLKGWIAEIEAWVEGEQPDEMSQSDWEWHQDQPEWLRQRLAEVHGEDLLILRNTILDEILRARGVSIYGSSVLTESLGASASEREEGCGPSPR